MEKASVLAIEGTSGSDGSGEDLKRVRRAFQPLPVSHLSHPLFASDRPDTLKLQSFHPQMLTRVVESPALKFPHNDNDPFCIFELPRNILVKVCAISAYSPSSALLSVTNNAINKLEVRRSNMLLVFLSQVSIDIFPAGTQGCGKSFLLLHGLQYCNARDWLVLYIPRATNLVNSTTAHTYDMRTRTYLQPIFAYQTLQRFLKINAPRLEQLRTQTEIEIERCPPVPPDTPLVELINIGLKDQCHAPTVLDAVLAEIGRQTIFPVVLAVDDFQALYCKSHIIFGYQIVLFFLMLLLLLEHASAQKSFVSVYENLGTYLGAFSLSNTTFPLPVEFLEALSLGYDRPYGPYVKRQPELVDHAHGLKRLAVPASLSVPEAASVFELWMKDRAVPSKPNDELFLAKYTEASGNARAFVWKELLSSMSA
ncbi:mitochondrial ribosomal death-associated protein 3-domain-containing protein [Suillus fuscotomentosus]|uniref:Small ribosomal subunit protein mS29 n=1 Tax=Suillus fuscotomentosus TaxID=1912939 RepID=A0AAD4HDW1_9AGAM|nr:mitochondrial ribosomal death-associated protein 3-domain-containing protein [Suillus fuscotomentosus]KAG1891671.1 mitochondrial ribosomal death-associated protein 3-domain-containing protein [Suillus fuscotomentosus]